jgi:hypothetical protein
MAATRDGTQNIVQLRMADTGDLAEAGLLRDLSDFVAKYRPDWNDKKWGYLGGQTTTRCSTTTTAGRTRSPPTATTRCS